MDEIRRFIQTGLSGLQLSAVGVPQPDEMVQDGETYFGYELQENYRGSDMYNCYTMEVGITGRLVRRNNTEENTVEVLDLALEELKEALKNMNIRYSYQDVSMGDNIRKILVTGYCIYNEMTRTIM